jgi:hypothetical protein
MLAFTVLAMVLVVIADTNAAIIVPLARTRVFDRRLASEPLIPAVGAVAVRPAINIIAASRAFA